MGNARNTTITLTRGGDAFEGLRLAAPILKILAGRSGGGEGGQTLGEQAQGLEVAEGKRSKENRIDDAEDRRDSCAAAATKSVSPGKVSARWSRHPWVRTV